MGSHDGLEVENFGESDFGRIDERKRTIRGLEDLVVAHNGGPLEGQTDVSAFAMIEARVDAMLEIAGHRDLWFLFLFRKHILCVCVCVFCVQRVQRKLVAFPTATDLFIFTRKTGGRREHTRRRRRRQWSQPSAQTHIVCKFSRNRDLK